MKDQPKHTKKPKAQKTIEVSAPLAPPVLNTRQMDVNTLQEAQTTLARLVDLGQFGAADAATLTQAQAALGLAVNVLQK